MDLESSQVVLGIAYYFVQWWIWAQDTVGDLPEACAKTGVVFTAYGRPSTEAFLRETCDLICFLTFWNGSWSDFSSCILCTWICSERVMEILEWARKWFSWLNNYVPDSYIPAFTDSRILFCGCWHEVDGELLSKGACKEPGLLENCPGTRARRVGKMMQNDVSWLVQSAQISRCSMSPFAWTNSPTKQLMSPVVEVVHSFTQAMLISLVILQTVAGLLLETHNVPVKNRKKNSYTHTKLHNCILSFIYSPPRRSAGCIQV